MRGTLVSKTWAWDPVLYAPPRYRKACRYKAFIPDPLTDQEFELASSVAGVVSDAEQASGRVGNRLSRGSDPAHG